MTIGKRIENRRKELDMSADTLAQKIGKSRATIYRYENGYIEKLPTDVLIPLAEALLTTPEYLMGWTDDPEQKRHILQIDTGKEGIAEALELAVAMNENMFSFADMFQKYTKLSADDRAEIMAMIDFKLSRQK